MVGVEIEPITWALLVSASFAGSFISAAWGLGGGALLLPIFATVLPPVAVIPVHGVVQLGSNFGRLLLMRRWIRYNLLPVFLFGAIIGISIGGLIATSVPPSFVLTGVGVFILWTVISPKPPLIPGGHFFVGVFSSVLTMIFGATGPFIAAWVKTFGFDRLSHVATQATYMTLQHSLKTITFVLLGFAIWEWWLVILVMIAAGVVGTFAGKRILMKSTDKRFQQILNWILVVLAVRLIWIGVSQSLGGGAESAPLIPGE